MDIEKLIAAVKLCGSTPRVDQCKNCTYWAAGDMSKCIPRMTIDAATALSMLQEENEKLRTELEQVKQLYESEKEDFINFACSGVPNLSPYCLNRRPDCVDERGWCRIEKCHGFSRELGQKED